MKYLTKHTYCLLLFLFGCSNQESKAQTYSSVDFLNYVGTSQNAYPNNSGMIKIGSVYNEDGNTFGNATIYLIHKDGGINWVKETFVRFPKATYGSQPPYTAGKRLLNEDKADQIEFAKWAFVIDKQYMESKMVTYDQDGGDNFDADGNLIDQVTVEEWLVKENTPIEVVLYEQLAGETQWRELERRSYADDMAFYESDWKTNFRKEKEAEYN